MAFGAISVLAGTRVLAGIDTPDYVVLRWLVVYNVVAGAAAVVAGAGVWGGRAWSLLSARILAGAHAATLVALVAMRALGSSVAIDSLAAMTFRTALWLAIAAVASRPRRSAG
jgi:hypothetical protein